jgi:hypothetical protein
MNVVMTCIRKEHHLVWLHDTCLMHNHVEKPLSKACPKGHAKFSDHCLDNIDFCKLREILTITKIPLLSANLWLQSKTSMQPKKGLP